MSKIVDSVKNARQFLVETKAEWKKVTTPNRRDVMVTTGVVVVTSFIFALFLWGADLLIIWLYDGLFEILH